MVRTSNDFQKGVDKRGTTADEFLKKDVRTFKIVEKEELFSFNNEKIKFLKEYKYYFDAIERFFNELKENSTKIELIFAEEKLDQVKINLIIKFIKNIHSEIKNKIVENTLEQKANALLSKEKKNFRSKSILEDLFNQVRKKI
jgi:hypothetical protein